MATTEQQTFGLSPVSLWNIVRRPNDADPEWPLINKAMQGDRRAFDTLSARYSPLLRSYLARRVSQDVAEDLLQETLVAAWHGLPQYRRASRFKAWLFGIALNKCRDAYRSQRLSPLPSDSVGEDAVHSGPDVYAQVDLQDAVQKSLAQLPDAQQEVLRLYYFAELTLPEIAQSLGRNLNTVKYQFYRAHDRVAGVMRDDAALSGTPSKNARREQ